MPFDIHTLEAPDGSANLYSDKIIIGVQNNVANGAGGGAGLTVTVAVAFSRLPVDASGNALYGVHVTPSQACFVSTSSKTASGFNVVLTPTTSGVTLSSGTFDVLVTA